MYVRIHTYIYIYMYNPAQVGFGDIFRQFVLLGWTAFGGPQVLHMCISLVSYAHIHVWGGYNS